MSDQNDDSLEPHITEEPRSSEETQQMIARMIEQSLNVQSSPYEGAIERNWTSEHTSKWLENVAVDSAEYRKNESSKSAMLFLLCFFAIVAFTVLVIYGHGKDVKEIVLALGGIGGVGFGSFWWGQSKKQ